MAALAALLLAGCAPVSLAMAERRFSEALLCPRDRMIVRERGDLPLHVLACRRPRADWVLGGLDRWDERALFPARCEATPPPEVSADRERLALWLARDAEIWRGFDGLFSPAVEVEGCGQRRLYVCERALVRGNFVVRCGGGRLQEIDAGGLDTRAPGPL